MPERLEGLSRVERLACSVAERTLGAVAYANDVWPRQGAVDAILTYPDQRHAAFEVTQLAMDGGASHYLDHLLGRDGYGWPLPGRWWWTVWIRDPRDLRRIRAVFEKVVLICEAVGVRRPQSLPFSEIDADIRWLIQESSADMVGYPSVPAVDGERQRKAMVTQPGVAAFSDETFSRFDEALAGALNTELIQRHVAKLNRTAADEHHLFIFVGVYDLDFSVFDALGFAENLPSSPPALPEGVSHLWLAPVYGRRVLVGTSARWSETPIELDATEDA